MNLTLKKTILSLIQMRNIKCLEHLSELSLPHYMHAYIWTTLRLNFSKMIKFSLGFCSVTVLTWTASKLKVNFKNFYNFGTTYLHMIVLEEKSLLLMLLLESIKWISLTACNRKPKVPGSSPAASYVQRWALCSNRPANV